MQIEVEQSQTKFVSYIEELKNYSSLNKEQENCINAIVYTLQNGYIQSWSSDCKYHSHYVIVLIY